MGCPEYTEIDMEKRIARFGRMKPNKMAFLDTRLPDHFRDIFNVIGAGVTENVDTMPAISSVNGKNVQTRTIIQVMSDGSVPEEVEKDEEKGGFLVQLLQDLNQQQETEETKLIKKKKDKKKDKKETDKVKYSQKYLKELIDD